ncbi:MAG TPA: lamin tail domain-containing protein, partial [Salinimicrobium sp.]|nr:lamin tail domain-containing protein [Salinimicrobium sp.]
MKKITFLLSLLISAVSFGQATDLYFSMYGEGGSNNKWLEIYNGTGEDVDLSNYLVVIYTNGNGEDTPGNSYDFAGMPVLADGEVFVIANASSDAAILAEADITDDVTFFNGDDAVVLYNGATIIDLIGEIGSDPDSAWAVGDVADGSANHTLIRKASVCSPNATPLGSFGTDADSSEWEVYDQDTQWEAIGAHTGCDDMAVGDVLLSEFVMYPNPSRDGKVT